MGRADYGIGNPLVYSPYTHYIRANTMLVQTVKEGRKDRKKDWSGVGCSLKSKEGELNKQLTLHKTAKTIRNAHCSP